jgi:two-component system, NarL family, nitrate/nitrite response regulator NarL
LKKPLPLSLRSSPAGHTDLSSAQALGIVIVSAVRFVRESLFEILGRNPGMTVFGHYATLDDALRETLTRRPDVFLLDAAFINGKSAVKLIRETMPQTRVVVFALIETEENIIAWAQVGIAGYIPSTAAVSELTTLLQDFSDGKQTCSALVVPGLLRQIGRDAHFGVADPASVALLTARELEILRLIDAGLSNKDIARHLAISSGTTKSHVHNILAKLNVQRRGQAAAWIHRRTHEAVASGAPKANLATS